MSHISVDQEALTRILNRNSELEQQNQELREALNRKLSERRGLRYQVHEFHEKFDQPVRQKVTELTSEELRFRLRLIMEEAMEVLEAVQPADKEKAEYWGSSLEVARDAIRDIIQDTRIANMVELVDALGDLDYVVEGTRLYLGVNGAEVAAEIHRANMEKSTQLKNGKPIKPEGWTPPDIEGVLRKQGWDGK